MLAKTLLRSDASQLTLCCFASCWSTFQWYPAFVFWRISVLSSSVIWVGGISIAFERVVAFYVSINQSKQSMHWFWFSSLMGGATGMWPPDSRPQGGLKEWQVRAASIFTKSNHADDTDDGDDASASEHWKRRSEHEHGHLSGETPPSSIFINVGIIRCHQKAAAWLR